QLCDVATGAVTPLPLDTEPWLPPGVTGWEQNDGSCRGVVFSSDGQRIFTGLSRAVVAWDAAAGKPFAVLEAGTALAYYAQALALAPDGRTLATCHDDHSIQLWDVSEPKLRETQRVLKRRAEDARAGKAKGPVEPAGTLTVILRGHSDHITAIAFHPD